MAMDLSDMKEVVRERLKTPFFGALFISFIACNWKAILVVFYKEEQWGIRDRFIWIDENLYPNGREWILLFPVLIALGVVTLLPYFFVITDGLSELAATWRHNIRQLARGKRQEVVKEIARLRHIDNNNKDTIARLEREKSRATEEGTDRSLRLARTLQVILAHQTTAADLLNDLHKAPKKLSDSRDLELLIGLELAYRHESGVVQLTESGDSIASKTPNRRNPRH